MYSPLYVLTSSLDGLGISGHGLGGLVGVEGNGRHVDLTGVGERSEMEGFIILVPEICGGSVLAK